MSPLTPSALDLSNGDNVVQARFELHRALDLGTPAGVEAWTRKWGEAALAVAAHAAGQDGEINAAWLLGKARKAHAHLAQAASKLAANPARTGAADPLRQVQDVVSDIITYLEEGE